MRSSSDRKPTSSSPRKVTVSRDRNPDRSPQHRSDSPRSAADVNPRDEDIYNDPEKPLVAGSREARQLHENPPRINGQLDGRTAGDAARPMKPDSLGKSLAPRGDVGGKA